MSRHKALLKKGFQHLMAMPWIYHPFSLLNPHQGSIFCFHNLIENPGKNRLDVNKPIDITVDYFEKILQYFHKTGNRVISLDEACQRLQSGEKSNEKFIVITFDDGYRSNYELAYPLLKRYEMPFTIFVATGYPDQSILLWWHPLEQLLLRCDALTFEASDVSHHYSLQNRNEKESAFRAIREMISRESDPLPLLKAIFGPQGVDIEQASRNGSMTWDQIRALGQEPLATIGGHTVNHKLLRKLSDEQSAFELSECKRRLEEHLQKPVSHFAYPFGHRKAYSPREQNLLAQLGYQSASTTRLQNVKSNTAIDFMALPRHVISGEVEDLAVVKALHSGIYGTLLSAVK